MLKSILLAILMLLAVMPRCAALWDECILNSDCDDGSPCTTDRCNSDSKGTDCDDSWCDDCRRYWCVNIEVDDGTTCEVDGQPGVCESGECRFEGETPDGGV